MHGLGTEGKERNQELTLTMVTPMGPVMSASTSLGNKICIMEIGGDLVHFRATHKNQTMQIMTGTPKQLPLKVVMDYLEQVIHGYIVE